MKRRVFLSIGGCNKTKALDDVDLIMIEHDYVAGWQKF